MKNKKVHAHFPTPLIGRTLVLEIVNGIQQPYEITLELYTWLQSVNCFYFISENRAYISMSTPLCFYTAHPGN